MYSYPFFLTFPVRANENIGRQCSLPLRKVARRGIQGGILSLNLHLRKIILTHILIPSIAMHAFYTLVRGLLTGIEELGAALSMTNGRQRGGD